MKVIEPSIEIIDMKDGDEILKKIEKIGRTCYKSENRITEDSAAPFVADKIKLGHESLIEHESITVKVICDRGVTHEIVRHRVGAAYSQESTRYCNYSKNKYGNEITVIHPCFFDEGSEAYDFWYQSCLDSENAYFKLLESGCKPEEARDVLPNSLKTELVMTMDLREWRHFLQLRTDKAAHPQIRQIANMILEEFKSRVPVIFDDIESYKEVTVNE